MKNLFLPMAVSALALSVQTVSSQEVMQNPTKNAYFGNLHVHTSYSFDGYTNGSPTGPDDAYRWAKGEAIPGGGNGTPLQINVPLDWYSVSDHAMFLGVFKKMEDPNSPFSKLPIAKRITSDDTLEAFNAYAEVLADVSAGTADPALTNPEFSQTIWGEIVETADAHHRAQTHHVHDSSVSRPQHNTEVKVGPWTDLGKTRGGQSVRAPTRT